MSTLDTLPTLPLLFRSADLSKFTGNANVFLTRARERGLITRLTRGVYLNTRLKGNRRWRRPPVSSVPPPTSALNGRYICTGSLFRSPRSARFFTLSTAVGVARNLLRHGVTIEYSHICDRLYFGFEPRDGYNLALPEKALLDAVCSRNMVRFADELELDLLRYYVDRLRRIARSFPLRVRTAVDPLL